MKAASKPDFWAVFLTLAIALGCRGESADGATPSADSREVSSPLSAPPPLSPSPPEKSGPTPLQELERITEEDYEEDAIVDISKETLDEELDRLEREIGQ